MFGSAKQLFSGEIYIQNNQAEEALGQLGQDQFGDLYRYGLVGGANVSAGKLELAPAPKTTHHNLSVLTAVTADQRLRKVTVTLGATAAVVNEYAGGYVNFNATTPVGQVYRISGHPAANSSATLEVTADHPWVTSISTSSKVTLVHNVWNNVVEAAAQTRRAAGVPMIAMTSAFYGWFKTRGVASVLADGAIALGSLIAPSSSVAGAVIAISGTWATALATTLVGQADVLAGVDTEYRAVNLTID